MIKNQLKISVVFITLFLALSIAAKAIGSLQPLNPTLRGFVEGCEDKPQPCWYGIVVGITTRKEAETIGGKLGFISCRLQLEYSDLGETISAIGLRACDGIERGDLLVRYLALPTDTVTIMLNSGEELFDRVVDFTIQVPTPLIFMN